MGDTQANRGFKVRMNQHICGCRNGNSLCKFPQHVFKCGTEKGNLIEPYFKINIMIKLNSPDMLISYEDYYHKNKYDILNR